jgi:hypothetical protein
MKADDETEYSVNLDLIIKKGSNYILAQDMATLIKMNGLMTVGMLLKSIEDDKLQQMIDFIEETHHAEEPGDETCHEEIMLITLMMIYAEGGHLSMDDDAIIMRMPQTIMYLTIEHLYRKGLVELKHENISFDEAVANRVVAKITQAGLDFAKGLEDD